MYIGVSKQYVKGNVNSLLTDYYRCPVDSIHIAHADEAGRPPGYFRLGPALTCYGRLTSGDAAKSPGSKLPDALDHVQMDPPGIRLPFDVEEVVENLRRERYAAHFREEGRLLNDIIRKIYYLVRPLMGVAIRRPLQRLFLRGWDRIPFPAWPVDTSVDRIHRKLLAMLLPQHGEERIPFIWFWPDGFSSCAIMTHDVEEESGRSYCDKLMDLDESYGIRSSFQLVPEVRYSVSRSFRESITSRGFEVNVHDLTHDGRLYAEHAEFLRRAQRINDYAREYGALGFRSGAMYRNADWFGAFEFSYDMSLPNVAHLDPQRGGCCTVMPFFVGEVIELPLTCTQDYTLFQILNDYSLRLWKEQIALIRQQHGLISFIIHPDYIVESKAQDTYKALLEYLARLRAEDGIWSPLPRDVADWWRLRSQMHLVQKEGKWSVQGPGCERARVAYASLADDNVVYTFE